MWKKFSQFFCNFFQKFFKGFYHFFSKIFHNFFQKNSTIFFKNFNNFSTIHWLFFSCNFSKKIPTKYIMCINLVTLVVSSWTQPGVESGLFYHKTRLHKIVLAEQSEHQLCNLSLKYSWCLQANGGKEIQYFQWVVTCRDSYENLNALTQHFIFSLTSEVKVY